MVENDGAFDAEKLGHLSLGEPYRILVGIDAGIEESPLSVKAIKSNSLSSIGAPSIAEPAPPIRTCAFSAQVEASWSSGHWICAEVSAALCPLTFRKQKRGIPFSVEFYIFQENCDTVSRLAQRSASLVFHCL